MFGVLYAASSEVFPGKHRGTGNGLTATAARVFSVLARSLLPETNCSPGLTALSSVQAPIIALYADLKTAVPVYIAGALLIGAGGLALLLPFEPQGKASI
jgi:hypothetical protein